ncbi:MAG: hypothetical protein Q9216_004260 [Gyalolechia sp. 2 TL-2023]
MAPRKGSRVPGAPRAGGYHVKTGCITCKIRHVKCDETRPECNKCISTGRKCDGYRMSAPPLPPAEYRSPTAGTTTSPHLKLHVITPSAWDGSLDELRAFDYFRLQTSEDLAYSLDVPLDELVLQTSHHFEAIKHAAIALGALGHTIRINSSLPVDASPASSRHRFANQQYQIAVRLLQRDMACNDNDSINFTLISCFLFTVFEFLQGNDPAAATHLRCGLNILCQQLWIPADGHVDAKTSPTTNQHKIQPGITGIFKTIKSQANMWLDLRSPNQKPFIPIDSPLSRNMAQPYRSLHEAGQDLNEIMNRIYNFRRYASKHDFARVVADVPALIYTQRDSLLDELDLHRRRLGDYLNERQTYPEQPEDVYLITVLRINRKVTTVMLATYLEPITPFSQARGQSHFWQVVSLATFILRPETSSTRQKLLEGMHPLDKPLDMASSNEPKQRRLFSFFAGLIQPLYFTAIKSPCRATAMKAIELLETEPWREGSWDSMAMAELARIRLQDSSRWQRPMEVCDTAELDAEIEDEGLHVEWPLATDPLITYPA